VVRFAQVGLLRIARRDDPGLRHSVVGLAISTGVGTALLVLASALDGFAQGAVWTLALALDIGGPPLIDSSGCGSCPATSPSATG
jgi:low temperature requirement protein LtrA